jgi:TolB-like protein
MRGGREASIVANVKAAQNRHLRSKTPPLRICLLGPVAIALDGRAITIASKKTRALLGYLAIRQGTPVSREIITGLLWGERGETQARASLRQALSELRGALAASTPQPIAATKETVTWVPGAAWLDTSVLEGASGSDDDDHLREAAELAAGELMEGLSIDEPGFEQWLATERERFRRMSGQVHTRLMEQAEHAGRTDEALSYGLRLLAADPLQERTHRAIMRLYVSQGRHDAALAQYERCRGALQDQLGVQPDAETEALAKSVRASRRDGPARPQATASPALPDKPSVAVLPFTNLTSEPEHDFFADGITEDLITALSRISELFVTSRSSSFVYKGRSARAEDVARDLGVRFVLGGSLRVAGSRVRVTTQLVDGISGGHVWADRYEGDLTDIFAVQDEITRSIALALQIKLTYGESIRLWEGQTKDLRAWEKMVLARGLFLRFNKVDNDSARRLLEQAIAIDPTYTGAMAQLGMTHWWDARFNTSVEKEESLRLAEAQVERILDIDPEMGSAYMLRGGIAFLRDRHDEAISLCQRAVDLAPSDFNALAFLGVIFVFAGEGEKAVSALKGAMRLSPHYPPWLTYNLAIAHLWTGRLDAAEQAAETYRQQEPEDPFAYAILATVYAFQQRDGEASSAIAQLRDKFPEFRLDNVLLSNRYRDREKLDRVARALRTAGLPG